MIITGGISPNLEGGAGAKLSNDEEVEEHRLITEAVHQAGCRGGRVPVVDHQVAELVARVGAPIEAAYVERTPGGAEVLEAYRQALGDASGE